MRILLIVPGGVHHSGREKIIPALLWFMERLSVHHDVLVLSLHQYPDYRRFELAGCKVVNLGFDGRLPAFLQRWKRLWTTLQREGWHFDIVHGFWLGASTTYALAVGRLVGAPVVCTIGGGELTWLPEITYGAAQDPATTAQTRLALKQADIVTAGSHFICSKVPDRTCVEVPLGVDRGLFAASLDRSTTGPSRLITVGTINEVKAPDIVVDTVAHLLNHQEVRLDWVGEDMLDGYIHERVEQEGLEDAIKFHNFLPSDRLAPLYSQAHLFLQASLFESQGVAVLEAAAAGTPTVGTAVGLVKQLSPGAARAVPVGDSQGLANAVTHLLDDRVIIRELATAAQQYSFQHDADWTAATFEKIYQKLIVRGRKRSR